MLELAILGLLIESPMHGYELRKRLTGLLGAFRAFSYGSLYPALRRMQADGAGLSPRDSGRPTVQSAPASNCSWSGRSIRRDRRGLRGRRPSVGQAG